MTLASYHGAIQPTREVTEVEKYNEAALSLSLQVAPTVAAVTSNSHLRGLPVVSCPSEWLATAKPRNLEIDMIDRLWLSEAGRRTGVLLVGSMGYHPALVRMEFFRDGLLWWRDP